LEDALPQLSETALDDAAQPLEDLEEHRRNVEDLTRTAAALDALEDIYRDYVRSDLHGRVDAALSIVDDHRAATRQLVAIRREVEDARAERDEARRTIETLDADERRLRQEIESLTSRDAYQ